MTLPEERESGTAPSRGSEAPVDEPVLPASAARPVIVQPHEGATLHAFGNAMQIMLGGAETGGRLALALETTPPGGGPPPHLHRGEDELFLVLEGQEEFLAEGRWIPLAPGGAVFLPRGTAHTFRNVGAAPSRHWVLTTPSGFEHFFAGCADAFAAPGGPDMPRVMGLFAAHGIELAGPPPGAP